MQAVAEMLQGREQPLARLITLVERDGPEVPEIMRLIQPHLGKAYRVGITGPPGAGKSSLADRLTALLRREGYTVGLVCADPTSPFTGGAVLGDRIRMQQHYLDEGVFIRSMATRGSLGGLPRTTRGVVKLLDAFGKDFILVETVGVGQTEMDVMEHVDTVVVVLVPEAGDTIQTMKAGLLEIADIFVVNKSDRPGSGNLVAELEAMLQLYPRQREWKVPVLAAEALNNVGIEEVYRQVMAHRCFLEETGRLAERRREQRK
ncbi:MAG: methylmalonyl Co-A mutase-associated GTPase MeaB, partial [Chloroflexota bacterium]